VSGWNCKGRLYRPRPEILSGAWRFALRFKARISIDVNAGLGSKVAIERFPVAAMLFQSGGWREAPKPRPPRFPTAVHTHPQSGAELIKEGYCPS
jgi:hypothetical protein